VARVLRSTRQRVSLDAAEEVGEGARGEGEVARVGGLAVSDGDRVRELS
jgi:hypothetical protein